MTEPLTIKTTSAEVADELREHQRLVEDLKAAQERIAKLEEPTLLGDIEAQAQAWIAVHVAAKEVGLEEYAPMDGEPLTGRSRTVKFIKHLAATVEQLRAEQLDLKSQLQISCGRTEYLEGGIEGLEQDLCAIQTGLHNEWRDGTESGDTVADFGVFLDHHRETEQQLKFQRECSDQLREIIEITENRVAALTAQVEGLVAERERVVDELETQKTKRDEAEVERDHYRLALVAAQEAHKPAEGTWQPMATAPKDGTHVLLWWPHWRGDRAIVGYFGRHQEQWEAYERLSDGPEPIGWQPLPAPPTKREGE